MLVVSDYKVADIMDTSSTSEERVTVALAGGGTGGHLTPGMSVAERLRDRAEQVEVVFLGSGRPVERDLLGRAGWELVELRAAPRPRSLGALLRCMIGFPLGMIAAWRLFSRRRPDVLVALGGYASLLPALCAALRHVPIVILEQNSLPGRANKFVARWAREIVVQWAGVEDQFCCPERVSALGNPIRRDVVGWDRTDACRKFGLAPDKLTLLVLGGSQGALGVNELVFAALPRLAEMADRVQILHATGEVGYEKAAYAYADTRLAASCHKFIHDMGAAYGCADLAVCRSGATTLAELTANGIPSILIPYPYAADDHQYFNAKLLSDAGAAVVSRQDEMSPEKFATLVADLLADQAKRQAMSQAASSLGRSDAAEKVADRVMRYALERRRLCGAS